MTDPNAIDVPLDAPSQSIASSSDGSDHGTSTSPDVIGIQGSTVRTKRRRRRRTNLLLCSLWIGLVAGFLFYVVAIPPIAIRIHHALWPKKFLPSELELKPGLLYMLRSCEALFVIWFFFLGACIGSFLNVVAWRIPRGESIVFGGSKCPFCRSRLSFLDNIPIFGWVYVQGRCRTCKLPIAPRYVLIEMVFGLVFLALALVELIENGANLPHWVGYGQRGIVATVFFPHWGLIGAYAVHCILFATAMMVTATHLDRAKFPAMYLGALWITGASVTMAFPLLSFVGWSEPFTRYGLHPFGWIGNQAITVGLGSLAGCVFGLLSVRVAVWAMHKVQGPSHDPQPSIPQSSILEPSIPPPCFANLEYHWLFMSLLFGTLLGWQAVLAGSLIAIVLLFVWVLFTILFPSLQSSMTSQGTSRLIPFAILIGATLIEHLLWRQWGYLVGIR